MKSLLAALLAVLLGAASIAPVAGASPAITLQPVATGFNRPLLVTSHGPNKLYVAEQAGIIRVMRRSSPSEAWQKAGVFLDIRALVRGPSPESGVHEPGLLGMAFHPNYADNGRFYVSYSRKSDLAIVVAEFKRRTNLRARPASARVLMVIPHQTDFHFGGWLGFGPDGYLYVSTGDAAIWSPMPSQDMYGRLGKLLRIDALAARFSSAQIPADNPFADGLDGNKMVWAAGMRNPWRASFDPATGDLWLPDVGQLDFEEVNVFRNYTASKAANLGWRYCEGLHQFPITDPLQPCALAGSTLPVLEYPHGAGDCAVIGGHVYRGAAQPALVGRYFFGDYCSGRIWNIAADFAGGAVDPPLDTDHLITSFGLDGLGELYLTSLDGSLWHVVQAS